MSLPKALLPWMLVVLLLTGGCGYQLVGKARSLPPDIQKVAIVQFENHSPKPGVERTLTDAVRQEFITDGRLTVVHQDAADLLITADIRTYTLEPVTFSSSDRVNDYRLLLEADVTVRDLVHKKLWLKQRLSTKTDFRVTANVASSDAAQNSAAQQGSREFAQQFLNLVLEGF
ncbi:MAG TPA: LptE family protein [bacterium]|nr:LptE family protein [bacterium]